MDCSTVLALLFSFLLGARLWFSLSYCFIIFKSWLNGEQWAASPGGDLSVKELKNHTQPQRSRNTPCLHTLRTFLTKVVHLHNHTLSPRVNSYLSSLFMLYIVSFDRSDLSSFSTLEISFICLLHRNNLFQNVIWLESYNRQPFKIGLLHLEYPFKVNPCLFMAWQIYAITVLAPAGGLGLFCSQSGP